jgi:hypothetical protein
MVVCIIGLCMEELLYLITYNLYGHRTGTVPEWRVDLPIIAKAVGIFYFLLFLYCREGKYWIHHG